MLNVHVVDCLCGDPLPNHCRDMCGEPNTLGDGDSIIRPPQQVPEETSVSCTQAQCSELWGVNTDRTCALSAYAYTCISTGRKWAPIGLTTSKSLFYVTTFNAPL